MKKHLIAALLCLLAPVLAAQESENSFVRFVYRTGDFLNAWAMRGVDSAYIGLPEFGWRAAFTAAQTGIHSNYTAKQTDVLGDVILHAFAHPDSVPAFATPNYIIYPKHPVHVSGTMRGGVSWEINRWVHLSAWAQADNVRFNAATENAHLDLSNWIWQAHLNIGVRFGVPKKRPALSDAVAPALPFAASATSSQSQPAPQTSSLPQWVSDYFFSIPGR